MPKILRWRERASVGARGGVWVTVLICEDHAKRKKKEQACSPTSHMAHGVLRDGLHGTVLD